MRRPPVRTRLALTGVLLLVVIVVVALYLRTIVAPAPERQLSGPIGTLDPQIIINMTQMPQATALAAQDANELIAVRVMVDACPAYDDARRNQMVQHIGFIINPSGLSREALIGFGANVRGGLLKAMSFVTLVRWRLDKEPADSCLIPIGKRINELLVAAGEPPEAAFEGD